MRAEPAADGLGRAPEADADAADRPRARLSGPTLVRLAVYWLGIAGLWAGLSSILAGRLQYEGLVAAGTEGSALFRMMAVGGALALVIQPAVGAISDHTTSRWGRRKPYIVAGSLADVVFLVGIANSNTVLAIAGFFLALQVSTNIAQGPYQGYVPDLVPARQVGLASGLVGLMLILGNVIGYVVGAVAIATGQYVVATVGLGLLEVATMVILVTGVREGGVACPRGGRSWLAIAVSAWGRDVLRERSFVWLVGSRLLVLTGGSVLTSLAPFYLGRTFALTSAEAGGILIALVGVLAAGTLSSVLPAGPPVRPGRAPAGDRALLRARGDGPPDQRRRAHDPCCLRGGGALWGLLRGVPGRRLGAPLRTRPTCLIWPVHGDQQRRQRVGWDPRGGAGRDRDGPCRWPGARSIGPACGPRPRRGVVRARGGAPAAGPGTGTEVERGSRRPPTVSADRFERVLQRS